MAKLTMAILLATISASGCFADDSTTTAPTAGSAGTGGTGAGTGGAGGSGASNTGGSGGTGGSSGTGGSGGASGSSVDAGGSFDAAGGAGGSAGAGGAAGTGGFAGTAGSGGVGTGGAAGASGAGGAGMDAMTCVQGTGPSALPFAVDEFFTASGWMGDVTAIVMDSTSCGPTSDASAPDAGARDANGLDTNGLDARAPDGGPSDATISDAGSRIPTAKCWTIAYTPADGGQGWAGVDWQFPANNWGTMNGRVIPRGAKRVRFYAWGDVGGEVVSFNVGYGFTSPDLFGMTLANQILTTTSTAYEIDLTGIEYTCPSVRMGFGWTTAGASPVKFHIDDIEWQ